MASEPQSIGSRPKMADTIDVMDKPAQSAESGQLVALGHTEIYVESQGSGEPLLLVAGLGGVGRFWSRQVGPFAEHFRVITHDHRGVGRSGPGPLISNAGEMADDLLRVMDALGLDSAHLVGHSTGGAIGQHIALRAPERLRSLVLSASWAGPTPLFVQTFRTRRDILINCGPLNYLMVGTLLAMPAWALAKEFHDAQTYLQGRLAQFPGLDVELGRLNAVMSHDLRHQLDRINTPTMVIGAHDDQLTPASLSEELAERIPGARLHLLEKGGHFCPHTVTERYNEAVLKFLIAQQGEQAAWQNKTFVSHMR